MCLRVKKERFDNMKMSKEHIESYENLQKISESLQKETVQIKDLKVGDVIAEFGYAFYITEIIGEENRKLIVKGISNFLNDDKKPYIRKLPFLSDYVTVIRSKEFKKKYFE